MVPTQASLESAQQGHNRVITAIGNNSASNDHTQHKHDMNSKLIASAEAFAAGRTLGMSEEETLAQMSKMLRRQRRKDETVTMNDIQRQMVQSANSIAEVSTGAEIQGVGYQEEPEVDPFGQDQGQYYEYGPNDAQYNEQQVAKLREALGQASTAFEQEEIAAEIDRLNEPRIRDDVAPQSVLRDALGELESAKAQQSGFQGALSRVFGGGQGQSEGIAQVEGRLEQDLDPRVDREASAALAAELVRRDSNNQNYRRAAYNTIKGQIEAEQIGEALYRPAAPGYITGAMVGDANLDLIGRGGAGAGFDFPIALQQGTGPAIDPTGSGPLGAYGPVYTSPNTDPSADLNAPQTTRAWMVERQPEYSDGGRSFGNYPQVDVTGATTLFANRLRGQEGFENVSSNIRSIDELQRVVDRAIAGGNMTFATREPVTGKNGKTKLASVRQQNPDVRGLLSALRYTPAQEAQLANAMYQLEVAANTEVNQQGKQQYYTRTGPNGQLEPTSFGGTTPGGASVFFNSPEAIDPRDGQAQVARINPGQTIEGRDIKTALGELGNPDAAKPFFGAVSVTDPSTGATSLETNAGPGYMTRYNSTGETNPIAIERALRNQEQQFAFNKAKTAAKKNPRAIVRPVEQQPVDEAGLRGKVVKAALATEREKRDNAKRADQASTIIANLPPNARRTRIR